MRYCMTNKKKIIYFVGGFQLPNKNASAIRVMTMASMFSKLGYEVKVIGKIENGADTIEISKDITLLNIKNNKTNKYDYFYSSKVVRNYIEKEEKHIHCVFTYNYPSIGLYLINEMCKKKGIPTGMDVTEWYGYEPHYLHIVLYKYIDTFIRMRLILKKMSNLICISQYLLNKYKENSNTIYIPYVMETNKNFVIEKKALHKTKKKTFIYAGSPGKTLHKEWLPYIVNSFLELSSLGYDFSLKIIGITADEYCKATRISREVLDNNTKIKFYGKLHHSDVISNLQQSDFSIFFREKNRVTMAGFPTKFAESLANGIPVITNPTSDIESFITNGKNGFLIKELNTNEILLNLKKILDMSYADVNEMKNYCQKNNPFVSEKWGKQIEDFLHQIKI